jgi:hypothetical protein
VLGNVDLHVGSTALTRAKLLIEIQELTDLQKLVVTQDACG